MAPVLDKKSPGVCQYQLRILQWNTNGIHRELELQEDLLEATNGDMDSKMTFNDEEEDVIIRQWVDFRRQRHRVPKMPIQLLLPGCADVDVSEGRQ